MYASAYVHVHVNWFLVSGATKTGDINNLILLILGIYVGKNILLCVTAGNGTTEVVWL